MIGSTNELIYDIVDLHMEIRWVDRINDIADVQMDRSNGIADLHVDRWIDRMAISLISTWIDGSIEWQYS
jgi:hypothetical protein